MNTHCPHCHCKLSEHYVPLSALVSDEVVEAVAHKLTDTDGTDRSWAALPPQRVRARLHARVLLRAASKALQEAEHD